MSTNLMIVEAIDELKVRIAALERLATNQPQRGCVCPPGANLTCANAVCPRKGIPGPTCWGPSTTVGHVGPN